MFWNNTYSDNGMNILVVSLGDKAAKEYCEIEMLNEKNRKCPRWRRRRRQLSQGFRH